MKKKIAILGSTGSIGKTLINIIKKDKDKIKILLLTTNKNYKELLSQVKIFNVKNVIVIDHKSFLITKNLLKNKKINVYNSFDQFNHIFKRKIIDYTMNAISGLSGLRPTLEIIRFSKNIAIANKESIICGWCLIEKKLKKYKTEFIPVDSEHFSIWSLIGKFQKNNIESVIITASGGPFKDLPLKKFKSITVNDALKHPNWIMGKKISVDSATMMNKVFEIIEAKKIFNLDYNKLKILIHSQSYIHAIVKFNNGLTKLLIHDTNMKIPIFNSLYPNFEKKIKSKKLNISILNNLSLALPNLKRFPIIKILNKLPSRHSLFETVLVSANDALVDLFLNKKINFEDISKKIFKIANSREFIKYKHKEPKNANEIYKLADYVSLKIYSRGV